MGASFRPIGCLDEGHPVRVPLHGSALGKHRGRGPLPRCTPRGCADAHRSQTCAQGRADSPSYFIHSPATNPGAARPQYPCWILVRVAVDLIASPSPRTFQIQMCGNTQDSTVKNGRPQLAEIRPRCAALREQERNDITWRARIVPADQFADFNARNYASGLQHQNTRTQGPWRGIQSLGQGVHAPPVSSRASSV